MYKIKIKALQNQGYHFIEHNGYVDILFTPKRGLRIYFNNNKKITKLSLLYILKKFNNNKVYFPAKDFDFDDLDYDEELKNDFVYDAIKRCLKICIK